MAISDFGAILLVIIGIVAYLAIKIYAIIITAMSKKIETTRKVLWILILIIIGWLGLIVWYVLIYDKILRAERAKLKAKKKRSRRK